MKRRQESNVTAYPDGHRERREKGEKDKRKQIQLRTTLIRTAGGDDGCEVYVTVGV